MPLTHRRTFQVRHHECDLNGQVRDDAYLRYMQETAFDASAAAGYDVARYAVMGRHWLIRDTYIEFRDMLRYGDSVAVQTWVADFRRVRSRRAYELRLAGQLLARAHTDWVFLDVASGRPAPIPPALIAAFFPEGLPDQAPPRERFPAAPPPPEGLVSLRRPVLWGDLDTAGHVNNAVYLGYLEDATRQVLARCGWPVSRMAAAGIALAAQQHRIEYRQPALPDDELEIAIWFSAVQPDTALRHATVTRVADGALLAQARTRWGCLAAIGGEPLALPASLVASLAAVTTPG